MFVHTKLLFELLSVIISITVEMNRKYNANIVNLIQLILCAYYIDAYLEKHYMIGFAFESSANDILYGSG